MAFQDDSSANPTVQDPNKLAAPVDLAAPPPTSGGAGGLLGAGPPGAAASAPGAAAAAPPKSNQSGSWANLNSYLNANQDQAGQMANNVTGSVTNEAQGAQNDLNNDYSDYTGAVDKATTTLDPDLIKQVMTDPAGMLKAPVDPVLSGAGLYQAPEVTDGGDPMAPPLPSTTGLLGSPAPSSSGSDASGGLALPMDTPFSGSTEEIPEKQSTPPQAGTLDAYLGSTSADGGSSPVNTTPAPLTPAQQFENAVNASYTAPTSFAPSAATATAYETAGGDIANAGSASGQQALLQKQYSGASPTGYNQGEQNLDQMLLGGSADSQNAFNNLTNNWSGIGNDQAGAATAAQGYSADAAATTAASAAAAQAALQNAAQTYGTAWGSQASDAAAKQASDMAVIQNILDKGDMSGVDPAEQAQMTSALAGITGTNLYGLDPTKYVTANPNAPTEANTLTSDEAAELNALNTLAGGNSTALASSSALGALDTAAGGGNAPQAGQWNPYTVTNNSVIQNDANQQKSAFENALTAYGQNSPTVGNKPEDGAANVNAAVSALQNGGDQAGAIAAYEKQSGGAAPGADFMKILQQYGYAGPSLDAGPSTTGGGDTPSGDGGSGGNPITGVLPAPPSKVLAPADNPADTLPPAVWDAINGHVPVPVNAAPAPPANYVYMPGSSIPGQGALPGPRPIPVSNVNIGGGGGIDMAGPGQDTTKVVQPAFPLTTAAITPPDPTPVPASTSSPSRTIKGVL